VIAKSRRARIVCGMNLLDRITVNPDVMTGKPCVRGLRLTVATVLGLLAAGAAREEILRSYSFLEPADIDACLAYAAWRTQEYEAPLAPVA
jgi:uncharacterized protein (DUF433 family)